MTNHIHLLIQVNQVPLSKVVQSLASSYSRYLNRQQNKVGHLFQGRYKSQHVQDEEYLIELCCYIHNNPKAAKMVTNIDDYSWSSHRSYMELDKINWLTSDFIKEVIKKNTVSNFYNEYIEYRNEFPLEYKRLEINDQGEICIKDTLVKLNAEHSHTDFTGLSINDIINAVCFEFNVEEELLASPSMCNKACLCRSLVAYYSHYLARHNLNSIAMYFFMKPDGLSRTLHCYINKKAIEQHSERMVTVLTRLLAEKNSKSD